MSWGTVLISNELSLDRTPADPLAHPLAHTGLMSEGKAYNGKVLPGGPVSMRKVRITATPQGGRQLAMEPDVPAGPRVKAEQTHTWTKVARARDVYRYRIAAVTGGDGEREGTKPRRAQVRGGRVRVGAGARGRRGARRPPLRRYAQRQELRGVGVLPRDVPPARGRAAVVARAPDHAGSGMMPAR